MRKFVACVVLLFPALSAPALAQNTFGEFVDMGATKVLPKEWAAILPATIIRTIKSGDVQLQFRPDGTLNGSFASSQGAGTSGITGTWNMDEAGKRCFTEHFTLWNNSHSECGYMYKLGDKYYGMSTDSDRAKKIYLVPYRLDR